MTAVALLVALTLLTALATLQALVALGLPFGRVVWGGMHRVLPRRLRLGSAASILVYTGIAVVLLVRGGVLSGEHSPVAAVLTWVVFAFFVASVPLNAVSRSLAERWTMTPAGVVLAGATLVIALSEAAEGAGGSDVAQHLI